MLTKKSGFSLAATAILLLLILTGIFYRFSWVNWNADANLHPDEYGLTNTLTQLSFPKSMDAYFNTRISPISPYQKYNLAGEVTGSGPDNRMRWGQWPIILLRGLGELTGSTGYGEIRLMGRSVSALLDSLTLLLAFLIGRRLYNRWVGLLGAALSSLAVMQIQQSHFMTVDNYAVFFSALTLYTAVRIAQQPPAVRRAERPAPYRVNWPAIAWYLGFGVSFGMALASKVNLAPLAGMILVAAFLSIADLKLGSRADLGKIFWTTALFLVCAGLVTLLTFRLTQPMSFRAASGDTTFWTLSLNQDWVDSMKVAQDESSGAGGGPPAEQWADRPAVIFPLMNMVVWGMGIPLGVAAWAGFLWAAWQTLRGRGWRTHLLPLIWTGGYFIFMATRWVKSVRYFLPIYPFLCLLAAWGLVELVVRIRAGAWRPNFRRAALAGAGLLIILVAGATLAWAAAFTNAVYVQAHTRIQATEWILANIPGPFQIRLETGGPQLSIPVGAPNGLLISAGAGYYAQPLPPQTRGKLANVALPHIQNSGIDPVELLVIISPSPDGIPALDQASIQVPPSSSDRGAPVQGSFQGAQLDPGQTYYLVASSPSGAPLLVWRNTLANEDWDEGLPVPYAGYDPFGQLYQGITMRVRWTDDENKRQAMVEALQNVDYIILPSQRSIWSISRLPVMYPMTLEYYRALFDGRLGFSQAALFQAPWKIGPLQISDAGGTLAWDNEPQLPLFNFNFFAAEEAFTVYDHPPVWIFKKEAGFSIENAANLLGNIDISRAVFQAPVDTKVTVIR